MLDSGNAEAPFLGTGWSFPPTFSKDTLSVDLVSGDLDIQQSLEILFRTSLGERVLLPGYGCRLASRVFEDLTRSIATEIEHDVRSAVLFWEPRIELLGVAVVPDSTRTGVLRIHLDYLIRQTNTRSNLVFNFYLREGTLPTQVPRP